MAPSLKELTTPPTEEEVIDTMLVVLASVGFPITAWGAGAVARTMIKLFAKGVVSIATLVAFIAGSGFLSYAKADWLTQLAAQVFFVQRYPATPAVGSLTFLAGPSAGPYTIVPQQLTFQWSANPTKLYKNTSGGTLLANGTLPITFEAESPGADYNAPIGAVDTNLTPLAGVTIDQLGSPPVITAQGTDEEDDNGLILRCVGRWGTVGSAANDVGYEGWARSASAQVTRVAVAENTPTDGHVTVTVAGPSGPVAGGVVTDVDHYINGNPSDVPPLVRRPLGMTATVQSATGHNVAATATLYVKNGFPAAPGQVVTAWLAYARTLDIARKPGGYLVAGGVSVLLAKLVELAEEVPGVVNVQFPALTDTNLAAGEVAVIVPTITTVFL